MQTVAESKAKRTAANRDVTETAPRSGGREGARPATHRSAEGVAHRELMRLALGDVTARRNLPQVLGHLPDPLGRYWKCLWDARTGKMLLSGPFAGGR